jgi:hypothetical protein
MRAPLGVLALALAAGTSYLALSTARYAFAAGPAPPSLAGPLRGPLFAADEVKTEGDT